MKLADGIRKHGFRKWYERELLQGHAHLVLLIFCALGLLGAFEAMRSFPGQDNSKLDNLLAIVVCGAVGLWALRRYLRLLTGAEATAHQADCPQCDTYARFTLVRENPRNGEVEVCCRNCQRHWVIVPPGEG